MNADKEFDDSTTTLAGAHVVRALPGRWFTTCKRAPPFGAPGRVEGHGRGSQLVTERG